MSAVGRPVLPMSVLLLLALWLGAVIFFSAVVAPAAFRVLPARSLAGALVGATLPVLFWCGAVVAVAGVLAALLGGGRRRGTVIGAGALMAVAVLAAQLVIAPRIERLRAEMPAALEQLPADDARRAAFGRLHGMSVALLGAAAAGATVMLGAGLLGREVDGP